MIVCAYCGFRYADDLPACPSCRMPAVAPPAWLFVNPQRPPDRPMERAAGSGWPADPEPPRAPRRLILDEPARSDRATDETVAWRPDFDTGAAGGPAWPGRALSEAAPPPDDLYRPLPAAAPSGAVKPVSPVEPTPWPTARRAAAGPSDGDTVDPPPVPPVVSPASPDLARPIEPVEPVGPVGPIEVPLVVGWSDQVQPEPAWSGQAYPVQPWLDQVRSDQPAWPQPDQVQPDQPQPDQVQPDQGAWPQPAQPAWAPLPTARLPETMFVPVPPSPELTPEAILRPEPTDTVIADSPKTLNRRAQRRETRSLQWVLILGAILVAAVLVAGALMIWG